MLLRCEWLTVSDLRQHFSCSRNWIERRLRFSGFPAPTKFGGSVTAQRRWQRADVLAWEASYQQANLDDLTRGAAP